AAGLQLQRGQYGFGKATLGFETHRIDHRIHTTVARRLFDDGAGRVIDLVEVDRYHAVGLPGVVQTIIVVIDHEDLLGTEHARTGCTHQPDRAGAIDRHATA